jgi:hypothetical protein
MAYIEIFRGKKEDFSIADPLTSMARRYFEVITEGERLH